MDEKPLRIKGTFDDVLTVAGKYKPRPKPKAKKKPKRKPQGKSVRRQ